MNKDQTTSIPMTRTLDDVYTYYKQSLDLLKERYKDRPNHPNYKELRALLVDQVNDELRDYSNDLTNRAAS